MKPFLRQVASHYFREGLDGLQFIFPSRRAEVFFRKYLAQEVKGAARPVLCPPCMTMDDFLYRASGAGRTDRMKLLLLLYECYAPLYRRAHGREPESLDEFIFWGDVILKDFSDVDKYLVDPRQLFANIADYRRMSGDLSYLSPAQREAVAHFIGSLETPGEMKKQFLQVWDLLYPLYCDFRARLEAEGLSYGGMAYRLLAERLAAAPAADLFAAAFPGTRRYVFVGLNALDECEKKVLGALEKAGLAEFCWDWSSALVRDPGNKASLFISKNILSFPQAFDPDPEGLGIPQIHVLGVASGIGQAKQLPAILSRIPPEERGERTAVILPDEDLLIPVLNSIPEEFSELNVSMGLPMRGSALFALMNEVAQLQLHLRCKDGWLFYHRQVHAIAANSLFRRAAADALPQLEAVRAGGKYYIPQAELQGSPLLDAVFRPVVRDPKAPSADQVREILQYQRELVLALAAAIREEPDMALELEFARRCCEALTLLGRYELAVLPATWFRLLNQLLLTETVPFRGEPLKGLQILGPLETRAVDFDNVIILSCNEGLFPRHPQSNSFVPAELRRGFGLPTFEYHDAMNAYYFYRLIQRAKNVWLVYDSRMKNLRAGEESRYIKQLSYLYPEIPLRRHYAVSGLLATSPQEDLVKTPEAVETIRTHGISASAVKDWLECPARLYYKIAEGLREEEEIQESLDAKAIGNVLHASLQTIYGRESVPRDYLRDWLSDPARIRALVSRKILEEMKTAYIEGRDTVHLDLVTAYVTRVLQADLDYLAAHGADRFEILGLELKLEGSLEGFKLKGFLDRLDRVPGVGVRVVDYKTGAVKDEDYAPEEGADKRVELMFKGGDKAPTVALQMFFYDLLLLQNGLCEVGELRNSIYAMSRIFVNGVEDEPAPGAVLDDFRAGLSALLAQIADPEVPFARKGDAFHACKYCDYRKLCKR